MKCLYTAYFYTAFTVAAIALVPSAALLQLVGVPNWANVPRTWFNDVAKKLGGWT